jgi:hypothetical protein
VGKLVKCSVPFRRLYLLEWRLEFNLLREPLLWVLKKICKRKKGYSMYEKTP